MKICITGSTGLIGSNLYDYLQNDSPGSHEFFLIDNRQFVDPNHSTYIIDILNYDQLQAFFKENQPEVVIHLAALIDVGESEQEPQKYWLTNLQGTSNVLQAMLSCGCKQIIFASTAAVYGNIEEQRGLVEDDPTKPVSVYGKTKLAAENLIKNYCQQFSFRSCIFRFFNVGGGLDHHEKQIHLIPLILQKMQRQQEFTVFGDDYNTRDGSCLRDYIHVQDLCVVITKAITLVNNEPGYNIFNLGHNQGYTVNEIIDHCLCLAKMDRKFSNDSIVENFERSLRIGPRRPGDPDFLLANPRKAIDNKYLQWFPTKTITDIIRDTMVEL